MRIVAQDGVDFPYEQIALKREGNIIYGILLGTGKYYVLAEYSSEEMASRNLIRFYEAFGGEELLFEFYQESEKNNENKN